MQFRLKKSLFVADFDPFGHKYMENPFFKEKIKSLNNKMEHISLTTY